MYCFQATMQQLNKLTGATEYPAIGRTFYCLDHQQSEILHKGGLHFIILENDPLFRLQVFINRLQDDIRVLRIYRKLPKEEKKAPAIRTAGACKIKKSNVSFS